MLYCETAGQNDERYLDELLVFASQMRAAGLSVGISAANFDCIDCSRRQFDAAPLVSDNTPERVDTLILLHAEQLGDAKLLSLRPRYQPAQPDCIALGDFPTRQSEISVQSKLSYILGDDPILLQNNSHLCFPDNSSAIPLLGIKRKGTSRSFNELPRVMLLAPDLEDVAFAKAISALARSCQIELSVMCNGGSKQDWRAGPGKDIPTFHFTEVLPIQSASRFDVLVCFQNTPFGYRSASLVANAAANGVALLDASESGVHTTSGDHFIRTSDEVSLVKEHLHDEILLNLDEIARSVNSTDFVRRTSPQHVIEQLGLRIEPSANVHSLALPHVGDSRRKRIVYMPTNGVGLGHAQRTSLIASNHDSDEIEAAFAAFPSCMKMLSNYGFDCTPLVSRSPHHAAPFANDLLNYSRLHALAKDASCIVFDGGYVFDSIYRTILDHDIPGVWVRRGMWQAGQDNSVALDREKVFSRVIIPTEAFDELNESYSRGDHICNVGPVVQKASITEHDRTRLRQQLSQRFGLPFDKLVVTMLGGGVAANRTVQLQTICGELAGRDDTLHLVVVWPTATVEPAIYHWRNTKVVKTHHAISLLAACDLFISAVGYNSFHEVLYNRIPAIFVPQMSKMMDDQHLRAKTAASYDAASMVEPEELATLAFEITQFLDEGKADAILSTLKKLDLPETGSAKAAQLIEEVTQCKEIHGIPSFDASAQSLQKISMI